MTKKPPRTRAPRNPSPPAAGAGRSIDRCADRGDLLQLLLERAALIYPCQNWLFGEIADASDPVEVEILAYSPTRFKTVYQGMRIPVLRSPFSHRLYEERRVSYVGEDNGTLSNLNPQFVETFALSSLMGIPLLDGGDIMGLLFAVTFKGESAAAPTGPQQDALERLAQEGANALGRLRSAAASRGQVDDPGDGDLA